MKKRDYISWSQYSLYKRSPDLYYRQYILGEDLFDNKYTLLGKKVADALEGKEVDGIDKNTIEYIKLFLPVYPKREYKITTTIDGIKLHGRLDNFNPYTKAFADVKTGKKFTQRMADTLGQLTFYQLMIFSKYKKLSDDIQIHWLPTTWDDEKVSIGDPVIFKTARSLSQVARLLHDIKKVKKEIDLLWKDQK